MKKNLITGGAGFIGSHLADRLLENGEYVIAVDNLSTGDKTNISHIEHPNFEFINGDVLNGNQIDELVQRVDEIYHLAAALGVRNIIDNPLNSIITNLKGTEIILEKAAQYNTKIFIASTSEVYGKQENTILEEESNRVYGPTTKSRWSYADCKAVDEFLALAYHDEKGLPVVIGRFFNTVGPRQTGQYGMVIPRFVKQALNNEDITVYNDGSMVRSFTHVSDAVAAMTDLMKLPEANGEIFNIGNGKTTTIKELAEKVIELTNSQSKITYIPYEEAYGKGFEDMQERKPSIAKINRFTGYEPSINLKEILNSVIEYYQSKEVT